MFAGFCSTALRTVWNCPHAGRAVPRAPRQRGITLNSCKTKVYVLRLLEVLAVLIDNTNIEGNTTHCSAASNADAARAGQSKIDHPKNEICLMGDARFVVSTNRASIHPRIKTVRNCPHAGRAVPRAPRQTGITLNRRDTKVDVSRPEVLAVLPAAPLGR